MYLLFDIGGTKTRLAITRDKKTFIEYKIIDTPANPDQGISEIVNYLKSKEIGILGVIGGIAGVLDSLKTKLIYSPNLHGWLDTDLKSKLIEACGTDNIVLENDAALNGLGEAAYGVGKDFNIIAFITVSTGVGGARIVNKRLDSAKYNFEPGHQYITVKSMLCNDNLNCRCDEETTDLESLISGAALEKKYGVKPEDLNDNKIWERIYHYLAIGLSNVIVFWSPDIIILGGGVTGSDLFSVDEIGIHLKKIMKVYPDLPIIKKGVLADHAGLYGALQILNQN